MSEEVPTIITWEGVPIRELSREDLEAAFKQLMHDSQYWMEQHAVVSKREMFGIRDRRKMDRMGR